MCGGKGRMSPHIKPPPRPNIAFSRIPQRILPDAIDLRDEIAVGRLHMEKKGGQFHHQQHVSTNIMNSPLIGDLLQSNLTPRSFPIDRYTSIFNYPLELAPVAKLLGGKRPEMGGFCSGRWCGMDGDDKANTIWCGRIESRHEQAEQMCRYLSCAIVYRRTVRWSMAVAVMAMVAVNILFRLCVECDELFTRERFKSVRAVILRLRLDLLLLTQESVDFLVLFSSNSLRECCCRNDFCYH